ncbi:uncharacterized protein METZ01_LOCUS374959, partial [marine metagenome]
RRNRHHAPSCPRPSVKRSLPLTSATCWSFYSRN